MSNPCRVVLVTHYFPGHGGGVESVAWELASRLAASGAAEITWFSSDTESPPPLLPGLSCVPVKCWNVMERRFGFPYPLWSLAGLLKLVRSVRASDAIHLHDYLYLPNLVAWMAARLSHRPVIVTQHIGAIPYRNPALRSALALANRLLGRLVLGGSTQVVFISETVRRYFGSFVRFRSPPALVPNGVDTERFVPAEGDRGSEPLLLFVGRFVEKKGLHLLRRLAQRLPQARWIFAGWGAIDPAGWKLANVAVHGKLEQEALVPLYQAADLLVLPSVGEGFPLVIQEAMACGTPALVGDETAAACPGAEALILHEPVQGDDEEDRWSARLQALLASPEALSELRPRVAAFARAHWSWTHCTQYYARFFAACAH
ncbi:MAG: glycosyltransferase family 4 protein [Betaproteobacteria bacterium]|nr:glycosyltransferase family 4 protein [Betaproteobacteria bacterium]MBV9361628.1 glycosyltransferase family 4 protein [Betaproteobacteria bacterium]